MPSKYFREQANALLTSLRSSGQYKHLRPITGPMGPTVHLKDHGEVICLCSNNYLGLANHPAVVSAGIDGLEKYGGGTASVRFICGTFDCHHQLEETIARFVGCESSLTYVSCWNANEAVFPTLCAKGDMILSDELNHASIIDSIKLARHAEKSVYRHSDMNDLEEKLKAAGDHPVRWVVTDGVFSMEGDVANLPALVELCEKYDAMLVVDDSHGIGVLGDTGRGTPEHFGLLGKIDVITGTLGKALGGAAGGYVAASADAIDVLVQRSRPSLFSNALPATVACSAKAAIDTLSGDPSLITRLRDNVATMRGGLAKLGFECPDSPTAIVPIMIGDTAEAIAQSQRLLELGVWVVGFGFPVVPEGEARLRVQLSSALENEHLERALDAFARL